MSRSPLVVLSMSSRELPEYALWPDMYIGLSRAGITAASIDTSVEDLPVEEIMGKADGLILGGGGDVDPAFYGGDSRDRTLSGVDTTRDRNERQMLEVALHRGLPVLGICRGAQLINVVRGGTLFQDLRRDFGSCVEHSGPEDLLHTAIHSVKVDPGSRLAAVLGTGDVVEVNSGHHQGVARVGDNLRVVARSADGLVEAVESSLDECLLGVQWHPENLWRTQAHAVNLLAGFASWCSSRSATSSSKL